MSKETKATLEEALRAHTADELEGAYLTDYVVIVAGVPSDGDNSTSYLDFSSDSPYHSLLGLVTMLEKNVRDNSGSTIED